MRKISNILTAILLAAICAACSDSYTDEPLPSYPDTLIGRWQGIDSETSVYDPDNSSLQPGASDGSGMTRPLDDLRIAINENGTLVRYRLTTPGPTAENPTPEAEWKVTARDFWKFISWDLIVTDENEQNIVYHITAHNPQTLSLTRIYEVEMLPGNPRKFSTTWNFRRLPQ